MDRCRWSRVLLLLCCAFLACVGPAVLAVGQDTPSDLSVTELSVTPASGVIQGDTVHVVATVDFAGAPPSAGIPVEITWRRTDKQVPCGVIVETFSDATGSSAARYVETWIDTSDLLPGTFEITAMIDQSNWFAETDESNNRLSVTLELLPPRPELHSETVETTPGSPLLWGETATISTLVRNTGRLASGAFHVEFQLFPVQCVDAATGETWRISVSAAGSEESPAGQWLFVSDADGAPSLASLDDLACMKLSAIAQRDAKRDLIDLHAIVSQHRSLDELLRLYQRKYETEDVAHLVYSLSYFERANRERTPKMLSGVTWCRRLPRSAA